MSERVVITGIGPVCAFGAGRADLVAGLTNPEPLFQPSSLVDDDVAPFVAEIMGVDAESCLPEAKTFLDRASELALIATHLALQDAGLDPASEAAEGLGLSLGTAYGGLETMTLFFEDCARKGPRFAKPFLFPHTYANTAASLIAIDYGLTGYHNNFAAGHLASAVALGDAYDWIRAGRGERILAGGYDALSEALLVGLRYDAAFAEGDEPMTLCEPFSEMPTGFVPGEGAAVLVLESLGAARARGATVLAELAGVELGRDALSALPKPASPLLLSAANGGEEDADEIESIVSAALSDAPTTSLAASIGETFGASTALGACVATLIVGPDAVQAPPAFGAPAAQTALNLIREDASTPQPASVVVTARDSGGANAAVAILPPPA